MQANIPKCVMDAIIVDEVCFLVKNLCPGLVESVAVSMVS